MVYKINGKQVTEQEWRAYKPKHASFGAPGGHKASCWPKTCDMLGVLPSQVKEAQKYLAEHGCPSDFNARGDLILRDRDHFNRYCRTMGYYHRNAGYGDVAPVNERKDRHAR